MDAFKAIEDLKEKTSSLEREVQTLKKENETLKKSMETGEGVRGAVEKLVTKDFITKLYKG